MDWNKNNIILNVDSMQFTIKSVAYKTSSWQFDDIFFFS